MRLIILSAAILALSLTASAQKLPTFAQYRAPIQKVGNINVDLSHRDAHEFRTNLRNAAKGGVNFAGHFVLTGWGCGTNCSQWAIIDGRNGRVYFPKEFAGVGFGFCDLPDHAMPSDAPNLADDSSGPLYYKKNSRLVVLTGYTGGGLNEKNAKCGVYYFEWTGARLRQIKLIAGKATNAP